MLSYSEIAKKWEGTAQGKGNLSFPKALLLSMAAGMYIAMGALGCTIAQSTIGGGLGKLLGACVFPAGLILVVLAGAELFTGNCLMAGPALKKALPFSRVLRNWGIVYAGNMLGAFLAALIAYWGRVLPAAGSEAEQLMIAIAGKKCGLSFLEAFVRGIGCNILVCGAVWMASGAQNAAGKAICCFFPVMLFVLCGLEHSVANMFYIPLGMLLSGGGEGNVSLSSYMLSNLLPVTLSNIVGGAGLSILYFQCADKKK